MDNARIRFIFDKKKIADNTTTKGLLQVEVRIAGSNKAVFISTGVKLYKNQVSIKSISVCKSNVPNNLIIDSTALGVLRKVEKFVLSEKCKNLSDVKNWNKDDSSDELIIPFMREHLRVRSKTLNLGQGTIKQHNVLINKLIKFEKIHTFKDLTYNNIELFDFYMKGEGLSSVSAHKRHSIFRIYIRDAINRGLLSSNPYSMYNPKKGKSKDPVYLTQEEVQLLKDYTPDFGYLERARDLFLFQCFTGLAYIDLMNFNKGSASDTDGFKVIRSNRVKTDENYITLFLPEAERIAIKYKYELPKLSNQKYNEYLKDVAKGAGINKLLVSHSARHTFATYLLNKDIPIETVSRALGHSNIKQTQHYARLLGKKVIEDMKKLL